MDRATEIRLIREILGLAARRSAFLDADTAPSPVARYASPERFDRERQALFRCSPLPVARSEEMEAPHDFLTREAHGLPLLLTRGGDGAVSAFLNVCRHRGARLERQMQGCKRVFTCPYHAWSYGADGALRGVPHGAEGFPDLDRAARGLRRVPVAEAHGFVWIVADAEAGPFDLAGWLGPLDADFAWLDLSGHRIACDERFEIAANWKLLIEGGLEAYHFRVAHAETIGPFFPDNLSSYTVMGPHIRSVLPRLTMTELPDRPVTDWSIRADANLLYTVMPGMQVLAQPDHVATLWFTPLSHDRTALRLMTLAPAAERAARMPHWERNQAVTRATLMEDFTLAAEIQSGFASRGNPSHLFGRFEGALDRFNRLVEERISG